MSETREKLEEALNENAAKNQDIAFQIKLKNPTHEPMACKSRKIAFHLKEPVRKALNEQLQAKLIRESSSTWASSSPQSSPQRRWVYTHYSKL
jgi:hypothetical protein